MFMISAAVEDVVVGCVDEIVEVAEVVEMEDEDEVVDKLSDVPRRDSLVVCELEVLADAVSDIGDAFEACRVK